MSCGGKRVSVPMINAFISTLTIRRGNRRHRTLLVEALPKVVKGSMEEVIKAEIVQAVPENLLSIKKAPRHPGKQISPVATIGRRLANATKAMAATSGTALSANSGKQGRALWVKNATWLTPRSCTVSLLRQARWFL